MHFPEFVEIANLFSSCRFGKRVSTTMIFTRQSTSLSIHLSLEFEERSLFLIPATQRFHHFMCAQLHVLSHALLFNLKGYDLGESGVPAHKSSHSETCLTGSDRNMFAY